MSDEVAGEEAVVETTEQAEPNWYDGMDDLNIGTAQNKGWNGPEDVIKSYREIEKHMGANEDRLLIIPDDPDDEDGWRKFYGRLGMPESPKDYKFDTPDDSDMGVDFENSFKEQAHIAGLNNEKAGNLLGWWNKIVKDASNTAVETQQIEQETELSNLKKEWGSGYEEGAELGRRAARHFGIDEETLNQLEDSMGTGKLLKLFKNIGDSIGEDRMVKPEHTDRVGYTAAQAVADKQDLLNALSADPVRNALYLQSKGDDYKRMQKIYEFTRAQEQ